MTRVAAVAVLAVLLMLGGAAAYAATVVTELHTYTDVVTIQSKGKAQVFTLSGTITDLDTLPDPVTVTVTVGATTVADTTPPSLPSNQRILNITQTSFRMEWGASSDNVAVIGYGIYQDGMVIATVNALSYTYTGLLCGTRYVVALDAVDAAGNRSDWRHATGPVTTLPCSATTTTPPPPTGTGVANVWVAP